MIFYVSSVFKIWFQFTNFVPFGYSIKFSETLSLFYKSDWVGNNILFDNFYYINL
jgi:hypothetical protein